MLKVLKIGLLVIAVCLAMYVLITRNFQGIPFMLFFLGLSGIVMGVSELKVGRKTSAILSFLASVFALFVSVYTFDTFS